MSEQIQGYTFKFKNAEGKWIEIPVLYSTMYSAYVAYCNDHSITPVEEDRYYGTVGQLKTYVDQLGGSTQTITDFTNALSAGSLPTSLGGLGVSIQNAPDIEEEYISYVVLTSEPTNWDTVYTNYYVYDDVSGEYVKLTTSDEHTWASNKYYKQTISFNTLQDFLDYVTTYAESIQSLEGTVKDLGDALATESSKMAYGTTTPDKAGLGDNVQYYFQYE